MNTPAARVEHFNWSALRYFNLYRIVISGVFSALSLLGKLPPSLTAFDNRLFSVTACSYLVLAVTAQFLVERRTIRFRYQVYGIILVDVAGISLLIHASGGVAGGFGMLLVVSLAGVCLLASTRAALAFASLATIVVLAETLFGIFFLFYPAAMYTQAGLLGAAFFGTGIVASLLAERARRGEALAEQRAVDIANLSQLNDHIVQRMRSGVLVLDAGHRVVLLNAAAAAMLSTDQSGVGARLEEASPSLAAVHREWMKRRENQKIPLKTEAYGVDAVVSFTRLGASDDAGTLVFVDDAAEIRQQAQQLKLVSLGRLTASIAHEIRNPLGAIRHAGQLLSESPDLSAQDKRLTEIIEEHSLRVNDIIENVMLIGRRKSVVSESFALAPWLEKFVAELRARRRLSAGDIVCHWTHAHVTVRIDKNQLHQVLWNLAENALRYSRGAPLLTFECGISYRTLRPYLDVVDTGPGMPDEVAEQVFEPFFTTDSGGTGLGLFIARELCESNQAALVLVEHASSGCRFRIHFAHPDRQQRALA